MIPQNMPSKKSFKLDDLSKELGVKKFVIKNWEKQFDCRKFGSDGRYNQEDYKVFAIIKDIVFNKKLSHSAAKKQLQDILEGKEPEQITKVEPEVVVEATPAELSLEQPSFDAAQETEISPSENQQEPSELTATCSEERLTEIKPAFKEKEEFFKSIRSLKEQLLKIHEQLK